MTRNQEVKRNRFLSPDEILRLTDALGADADQQVANAYRLLMPTGARRGEVLSMRWADINLADGTWTKPASTTKQRTLHHVPLSAPARLLLTNLRGKTEPDAVFVFPGPGKSGHIQEMKKSWRRLCQRADIQNAKIHDLRHTFASVLVGSGLSLPIIGELLGHSNERH